MEYQQEVLQIGTRCYDKSKLTTTEKRLLLAAYRRHTGKQLQENCGNCYAKIYLYFLNKSNNLNQPITMETNKKFRIKEGKRIMLHGMSEVYTNANITDEAAMQILHRSPKAIQLFSDYPNDWRERAAAHVRTKTNGKAATPAAAAKEVAAPVADKEAAEFDKDEFNVAEVKRQSLEAKSEKELREMCASFEMDEADYKKAKKPALVKMLLERIS